MESKNFENQETHFEKDLKDMTILEKTLMWSMFVSYLVPFVLLFLVGWHGIVLGLGICFDLTIITIKYIFKVKKNFAVTFLGYFGFVATVIGTLLFFDPDGLFTYMSIALTMLFAGIGLLLLKMYVDSKDNLFKVMGILFILVSFLALGMLFFII